MSRRFRIALSNTKIDNFLQVSDKLLKVNMARMKIYYDTSGQNDLYYYCDIKIYFEVLNFSSDPKNLKLILCLLFEGLSTTVLLDT